jgi:hypothetical protein
VLRIGVKLPPRITQLGEFVADVTALEAAGADGLVLFNRLYQPDIDLDTLDVTPRLQLSTSAESRLPLHWIGILRGVTSCSLAATTGVYLGPDAMLLPLPSELDPVVATLFNPLGAGRTTVGECGEAGGSGRQRQVVESTSGSGRAGSGGLGPAGHRPAPELGRRGTTWSTCSSRPAESTDIGIDKHRSLNCFGFAPRGSAGN